jgi:DNA-binding NtrC family response regulator
MGTELRPIGSVRYRTEPGMAMAFLPTLAACGAAPTAQTVLIAEDESLVRLAIADHLRDSGFHVIEAQSADRALTILQSSSTLVDVLFTDVQMPGRTDGIQLIQWVQANRPLVAVLLTSGDSTKIEAARSLMRPITILPKPYDFEEVAKFVRSICPRQG